MKFEDKKIFKILERKTPEYLQKLVRNCKDFYKKEEEFNELSEYFLISDFSEAYKLLNNILDEYMAIMVETSTPEIVLGVRKNLQFKFVGILFTKTAEPLDFKILCADSEKMRLHGQQLLSAGYSFITTHILNPLLITINVLERKECFQQILAKQIQYKCGIFPERETLIEAKPPESPI